MLPNYQLLPLIQVFRTVALNGSFQKAANLLELPRSSVSKKIQQLEKTLEQPLFTRSTRKLVITEFGQALLKETLSMEPLINKVDALVAETLLEPRGKVRITTSALVGERFLIPLLSELKSTFPDIELDLSFNDDVVDLYDDGADIAIRTGELPDSSLIAKRVGIKTVGWFASPEFIAQNGEPSSPETLNEYACLICKNSFRVFDHWQFKNQQGITKTIQIKSNLAIDNSRALVEMVCMGLGISMLDPLIIKRELEEGKLVPVLTKWTHPETSPINIISLSKQQRSRAAECVWQYLSEHLKVV